MIIVGMLMGSPVKVHVPILIHWCCKKGGGEVRIDIAAHLYVNLRRAY